MSSFSSALQLLFYPIIDDIVADTEHLYRKLHTIFNFWQSLPCFQEGILGQIPCISFVMDHVHYHSIKFPPVPDYSDVKCLLHIPQLALVSPVMHR